MAKLTQKEVKSHQKAGSIVNLSRADLNEGGLLGIDLSRADLSGIDLSRVDLSGSDLSGADLSRANLSGAKLIGTDLSRADLNGTDLSRADLSGAKLIEVDLSEAKLIGAKLIKTNLSGANLIRANLYKADLSGANLSQANMIGAILSGVGLKDAIIDQTTQIDSKWHLRDELIRQNKVNINLQRTELNESILSEITPSKPILSPEEIDETSEFYEGATQKISINKYERNPQARKKCIEYYGAKCVACGISFEKTYNGVGKGFIHVHHLKPLSKIGEDYIVDPIRDLRPVCPNCHAVIHMRDPIYSIEEVKTLLKK